MIAWILLIVSFAFGNIYKFSFWSPEVKVSLLDCTVLVLTIMGLRVNRVEQRLILPILVFFSLGVLSLVLAIPNFGISAVAVGAMYLLRWVIYSLFFISLVRLFKVHELGKVILSLGLVTTLVGLGQYLFYPDVRNLQVAEWDPHYFRVVGSLLDPGFTGIILVFTLIWLTLKPLKPKWGQVLAWGATYLALALTYSRSSYLAFLVGMGWIAWKLKGWRFLVKMVLLLGVTVLILPRAPGGEGVKLERTNSIQSRIDSWTTAWRIFTQHPVLGVGFNVYRYAQGSSLKSHAGAGADSSLLFVAATTGILGLGAYLWYLRRLYLLQTTNYMLQATLVAVLAHSTFLNSLFYPAVMVWLALVVAATAAKSP